MKKVIPQNKTVIKNGIGILTHLEKIYEELISESFGKNKIVKNPQGQILPCMVCGNPDTFMIWSENYSGYRGICDMCEYDWPES